MKWFRFYAEALNDPKILRLSDKEFRAWVLMLCIAAESDGKIDTEDLGIRLRMREQQTTDIYERLISRGLVNQLDPGWCEMHNWNARQYKSDVSTPRVKRFRERIEAVSETPPDTDTETDTDPEQKQSRAETERAPSHPFSLAFAKEHQKRNAGRPPPPTQHAEAVALEDEHGADWCFRAAEAFGWQKGPAYLRPWIIDHKEKASGNANGTDRGKQTAGFGAAGVAAGVSDLERRRAAVIARGGTGGP